MGFVFMKKKKVQNKNLHNYSNTSTPYNVRLTQVGMVGDTRTVLSSSSRQLLSLMDLSLDIYIIFLVSERNPLVVWLWISWTKIA